MELSNWNERPARRVPLNAEERVHELWGLQVVDVAVLQERSSSGILLVPRFLFACTVCIEARRIPCDRLLRATRLRSAGGRLSEEVQLVPMFNEVLPLAEDARSFAPRHFRNACEGVALGAGQ